MIDVVDEGVVGFGVFFLAAESTLLVIATGSGVALCGLPLFRGEGVGFNKAVETSIVVAIFGGRPRFLAEEGTEGVAEAEEEKEEALVIDLGGLPRFLCCWCWCSITSAEFAAAFGVLTRLRGGS